MSDERKTIKEYVEELKAEGIRCACDLDNWEPERGSGHSRVCPLHKIAYQRARNDRYARARELSLQNPYEEI